MDSIIHCIISCILAQIVSGLMKLTNNFNTVWLGVLAAKQ